MKLLKKIKLFISKLTEIAVEEEGNLHHEKPIEVDPPIKPKEEEK